MEASLANSNVVDSIDGGSETCEGKWLQLDFAGESFVFCKSPSNKLTHAMGQHLDLDIEYLSNPLDIPAMDIPTLNHTAVDCPTIQADRDYAVPTSSLHTRRSLFATTSEIIKVAQGQRRLATLYRGHKCVCKGTRKPCLFVHGVGQPQSEPLADTFEDVWGKIQDHAPCCTSVKFAKFEMLSRGWDNLALQQEFCNAALQVSGVTNASTHEQDQQYHISTARRLGSSNRSREGDIVATTQTESSVSNTSSSVIALNELGDLILVTFSMGNLVASGAFANGVCRMSKEKVTWVSLAAPMQGSAGANSMVSKCEQHPKAIKALSSLDCPASNAYLKLTDQFTAPADMQDKYVSAQAARTAYVSKVLCGTSPKGLSVVNKLLTGSINFANYLTGKSFQLTAKIAFPNEPYNDGLVSWPSCNVGVDSFSTNAMDHGNYQARINHYDASFRNGDGWWGSDRKPVQWFECAL
jgi:hypothetical protein